MRHRVTGRKLGRTASHRRATLSALSTSLIQHKRIRTTLAKAKATQRTIEPIITRAKLTYRSESSDDTKKDVHARRMIARFIKNPAMVQELFDEIAPKVADRNGGYTRVVKLGQRDGDGAHLAIIELVDYNEAVTKKAKQKKKAAKAAPAKPEKKKEEETVETQDEKVGGEIAEKEETEKTKSELSAEDGSDTGEKTKSGGKEEK